MLICTEVSQDRKWPPPVQGDLDLWLLISDNHMHSVWLVSAPSLPGWQRNKPETIVSFPKCFQWQWREVQCTRSLHWCLQGHTGWVVKWGSVLGAAQAPATAPNSATAMPGQLPQIPKLFPSSRTIFSPHSWDIVGSVVEYISAGLLWVQLQCIHSSGLTAAPAVGRKGRDRADVLRVLSSEEMPDTGAQATKRGLQKRLLVLPQEVLSQGAKAEQFPVGAAPNEVHGERAALTSRVWYSKPLNTVQTRFSC